MNKQTDLSLQKHTEQKYCHDDDKATSVETTKSQELGKKSRQGKFICKAPFIHSAITKDILLRTMKALNTVKNIKITVTKEVETLPRGSTRDK